MKTTTTIILTSLVLAAAAVTGLGESQAEAQEYRLRPEIRPSTETPTLGFKGWFNGDGVKVDTVLWGTEAKRIGLERGDTIVAVNGRRMRYNSAFRDAVQSAVNGGGNIYGTNYVRPASAWINLTIRDVNSGRLVTRTTNTANW